MYLNNANFLVNEEMMIAYLIKALFRSITKNKAAGPRKLFVDISAIYVSDGRTGIQRVVRSILSELFKSPPSGFEVYPVYAEKGAPWLHTHKYAPQNSEASRVSNGEKIQEQPGDAFLGLDLGAHLFPEADEQLERFKLNGVRVYFVVYDLIPLLYPEFSVGYITEAFCNWMSSLNKYADMLICISGTVANDVNNWLKINYPKCRHPAVSYFNMGSDIDNSLPTQGRPENAEKVSNFLSNGYSFLMVGTIEPRKGHKQVLSAFESLWKRNIPVRLIFVGKEGWNMEDFTAYISKKSNHCGKFMWVKNASDEFLNEIYNSATCLIAASYAEGFGLPLVEAAQHNLPVIARDIPVFKEVAGKYAQYFSSNDPEDLADTILKWTNNYASGELKFAGGIRRQSWRESTKELKKFIY